MERKKCISLMIVCFILLLPGCQNKKPDHEVISETIDASYQEEYEMKAESKTKEVYSPQKDSLSYVWNPELLTIRIEGSEDDLYGYENGILCYGREYDIAKMTGVPEKELYTYGNFQNKGREYERQITVRISDSNREILSQSCGMRVMGAASRKYKQKSLKLYARKEYGEKTFHADLFDMPVTDFKHLVIRSSGNDNNYAFIRNELAARLAYESGFMDVVHARPARLYINDVYQGFYWLEDFVDKQWLRNFYKEDGISEGEFIVYEGNMLEMELDTEIKGEYEPVRSYIETVNLFKGADLNDPNNYEALCRRIDVDNYLKYAAIQLYIRNTDWLNRNRKVYRYVTNGTYKEGTVYDGRYRFILYDLDCSMNLSRSTEVKTDPDHYFEQFFVESPDDLFKILMTREDCRKQFKEEVYRLIDSSFSAEHALLVLEEMNESRWEELMFMFHETDYSEEKIVPEDFFPKEERTRREIEKIKSFLMERPEQITACLEQYLPD